MNYLDFIYAPFAVFVAHPAAALVPAALFALGFFIKKTSLAGLASVLWVLYAGYEALMKLRVLCAGECNIRVDLLVLYPALFLVSLAAIVDFLVRRKKASDDPA
jgi:hypothetical protein